MNHSKGYKKKLNTIIYSLVLVLLLLKQAFSMSSSRLFVSAWSTRPYKRHVRTILSASTDNTKKPFFTNMFKVLFSSVTEDYTIDKKDIIPSNPSPSTFFLNVNEKVKQIRSSGIELDPRTIFFSADTMVEDIIEEESMDIDQELLYTKEYFGSYKNAIEDLLETRQFLKREDPKNVEKALEWIYCPYRTIDLPALNKSELEKQRDLFIQKQDLTRDQYQIAMRVLCTLGDYCAKRMLLEPILIAWQKVKEAGMILREPAINTYLYIVGNSIIDQQDIIGEVALFHDLLYKPTENSITLRIKTLVSKNQLQQAESLLSSFTQQHQLKLRTYFPVLKGYCEINDCNSAFRIFYKMRVSPSVILEPENYILFLSTLVENGVFTNSAHSIAEAIELGYSSYGTELFDELLTDMSHDVLEINSSSARRLYNAFHKIKDTKFTSTMKELPSLVDLPLETTLCSNNELVVSRVSINSTTANCPRTNAKLRLILLSMEDKRNFYDKLLTMSQEQYFAFVTKNAQEDEASKKLMEFANWLDNREGEPFTAIIDGANVAYFGQNFDSGRFNYHQIMFLVHTLEKMNENPLVVVPFKYTMNSFTSNSGPESRKQFLTVKELQVLNELKESGKLYVVPARCLDDYYWMLASVSNQTTSRSGRDINVPVSNPQNRWPGTRPMLLSNDQMRDHRLEVLEPRLFRRWTTSHIVNYNFTAFCVDEDEYDKDVTLSSIDFFSREIQGNPTEDGLAWHLPVKEWDPHERLCIRIPKEKN